MHLIARGAPGDEPKLKAALETALRELGVEALPGVAFPGIVTGQDLVEKSLGDLISESMAVGFAGGLVLILAALGIVGVVGFMVATRTRELAVRMALGATRLRVFGLMLTDVVKLVIPGVVGGLVLGAVLIRTMQDVMGTPLTVGPTPLGVMEPVIYARCFRDRRLRRAAGRPSGRPPRDLGPADGGDTIRVSSIGIEEGVRITIDARDWRRTEKIDVWNRTGGARRRGGVACANSRRPHPSHRAPSRIALPGVVAGPCT